jgi:formylglycine-generating enzyme required for sulfatase activity
MAPDRHVVFVSYRTADALGLWGADRIFTQLAGSYDVEVFKDDERIEIGESIAQEVDKHLQRATVLVVVIGKQWFDPREGSRSAPIHLDDDWVRAEIRTALERKIPIIPLAIGCDRVQPRDLPPDIRSFVDVRPGALGAGAKSVVVRSDHRQGDLDMFITELAEALTLQRRTLASARWQPASEWQMKHLTRLGEELGTLSPAIPPRDGRQRFPLSEVFVPLELATDRGPLEADDFRWDTLVQPERSPLVALTGAAGSGKSTMLRHLGLYAADLRASRLKRDVAESSALDRLPLWIDLPAAARTLRQSKNISEGPLRDLAPEDWLAVVRRVANLEEFDQARGLLDTGELLLLFDGLDEVVDPRDRIELVTSIAKLPGAYGGPGAKNPAVIACREKAWERGRAFAMFDKVLIRQMSADKRQAYLQRWCRAVWGERGDEVLAALTRALRTSRAAQEMASNPQTATMLAVRASLGPLPQQRVLLYDQIVGYALESDRLARHGSEAQLRKHLVALALEVQSGTDKLTENRASLLLGRRLVPNPSPEVTKSELRDHGNALLQDLELHTGLVTIEPSAADDNNAGVRFTHRTVQEFLVASHFADLAAPEAILAHVANPAWVTSIGLTAGVLAKAEDWEALGRFLERVVQTPQLDPPPPRQELIDWGKRVAVLSECLEELSNWSIPEATAAHAERAHEASGPLMMHFDLVTRASIADGMGLLRDRRLGKDAVTRWVEIAAGPSTVGSDSQEAWPQERPARQVELSAFWIQRWPTTTCEFARFVEEADGYKDPQWWDVAGWKWRCDNHITHPKDWDLQRPHGNRPVTGISWWEARAYARWLTSIEELPEGWSITLPTEAQWERAARGPASDPAARCRRFPWGDLWENGTEYANCDNVLQGVCAVGLFPDGHSVEGLWDLGGNVRERCLDGFGPPTRELTIDPCHVNYRFGHVVRGGDYTTRPLNLRVAARFADTLTNQSPTIGLRCAAWSLAKAVHTALVHTNG